MLYANGYDKDAEKLVPVIEKRLVLGKELLRVIGGRTKHLIEQDSRLRTLLQKKSLASQGYFNWLTWP